ncbi:MAG: 16S rRNA (cytidine(1402)-2'-O)-methyltransferase [Parachlamydiales bacterium]|jgi:16S rRNA (cytidine1402-2'-O)-methyltransferase
MLYLIATPIGNLEDITLRALKILRECDYILAEDTRNSGVLLRHFQITKKCLAFEKFSEKKLEEKILEDLEKGQKIALISDAGTPLISDPGESLVRSCLKKKLPFTYLPGACSVIGALVLSGFKNSPFQFRGFLEKKTEKLKEQLRRLLAYRGTSVAFESPHRIEKTLKALQKLDPKRNLAVAREMTKLFEETRRGKPAELIEHFSKNPPKGEIVLIIEEGPCPLEEIKPEELLEILKEEFALSTKEALKMAAKILKTKKNQLYKKLL